VGRSVKLHALILLREIGGNGEVGARNGAMIAGL